MKGKKKTTKGAKPQRKGGKSGQWADHLTQKAKSMGYPARSVFKLEDIQNRFQIIKKGDTVLDLGCSPGAWTLYAAKLVGDQGRVLGIDLKAVETQLPPNALSIQDDILNPEHPAFIESHAGKFNAVISDMAPATTGRKDVDAIRSVELCRMALDTALKNLAFQGNFVCKIFQGNDFKTFEQEVTAAFKTCRVFKPESCRKQSKEIYIIGKEKIT
ncbi:SAM-dependent methyltransferase [Desulfobacter latus]|uniref:Ribosomal RNA large subunit methyltransferase E n=1 Tax=Desulfobacter latus TaxID=2292 RepID=A0A850TEH0_9BACT|nr:RlmE family RNA methyltransferase [Desulfobacter latus]NWH05816.1 RlmE family RNA methyltransferase [Desulfobacter latus]